ncbi:MAG: helix-turn-helix domain-containing protein [Candidatus Micrarchaeia archaeon]|jgi:predicted transcriptional regulator
MNLKLSKNEIIALEKLCTNEYTVGELARELKMKGSYASRLVKALEEKGLAYHTEKRKVALSPASHAQGFKKLYLSKPQARMEEWLCGHSIGILVLAGFNEEGTPIDIFWKETPCSKPTTYKVLNRLMDAGVLVKNGKVMVSDKAVQEFALYYSSNLLRIVTSNIQGMKTSIGVRMHVVVRAHTNEAPQEFVKTGMTALAEHGLEALQASNYYYYTNLSGKQRKIGVDEAFIHALLMTTMEQGQDKQVLALFLMKNKGRMNISRLRELARQYGVESELATMRDALDYVEKAV